MTGGLREYWDLPARGDLANGNGEFSQRFRAELAGVNQDLQTVAIRGVDGDHQKLDGNRQTLITAYQNVAPLGDAAKNEQVMGAVTKVKQQTSAKATSLNAGYEEWQKREAAFDAAVVKIGEFEDSGHPKAPAYRQVSNAIQSRVNGGDFQNANSALDQLLPKLDQAHVLYLGEPGGFNEAPSGGSGDSSNSSKPAVVPKGAVTADSHPPSKPSNTTGTGSGSGSGGTINTTGNPSSPAKGKPVGEPFAGFPKIAPDSSIVTIQTVNGPVKMTVDDYRWRHHLASEWVSDQLADHRMKKSAQGPPTWSDRTSYNREAAKRYYLDEGWVGRQTVPGTKEPVILPAGTDIRLVPPNIRYEVPKVENPSARGGGSDAGKSQIDPHGKTQPAQPKIGGDAGPGKSTVDPHGKTGVDPHAKTGPAVDPHAKTGVDAHAPTQPGQAPAAPANEKAIAEISAEMEEAKKLAKSGNPADIEKARQRLAQAEKQADVVATSIKPNATAKRLASDAKSAALKASGITLKFLAAYAIIEDVRKILDSKSVSEALEKTFQVAKGHGKEAVKIGALRFVTRSTPIAVGLSIILQTNEETDKQERGRKFDAYVALIMNQIRPGSAYMRGGNQPPQIIDMELYAEVVKQVKTKRVEHVESDVVQIGYHDGLTGSPKKKKFEVSQADEEDLGLNSKTMESAYFRGYDRGERERIKVPDRARHEGYQDALEGKPSNFERLKKWPEIHELLSRLASRNIGNEEYNEYNGRLSLYGDSYRDGYEKGKKSAEQRTLQRIEIKEGKSLFVKQYSAKLLKAMAVLSEGPTLNINSQSDWNSSDPKVARIVKEGERVEVRMDGAGKATISAKYQFGGITKEAKLDITVEASKNKPQLKIYFQEVSGNYHVGDEVSIRAVTSKGETQDLPVFWKDSKWTATPENAVSISPAPGAEDFMTAFTGGEVLVKMLKEGKVTVEVTSAEDKTLSAKTEITIRPKNT